MMKIKITRTAKRRRDHYNNNHLHTDKRYILFCVRCWYYVFFLFWSYNQHFPTIILHPHRKGDATRMAGLFLKTDYETLEYSPSQ